MGKLIYLSVVRARRLENQPAPPVDSVTEDLLRWILSQPETPKKSGHATGPGAPGTNKNSKPSVEALSEILQRSLSKDPALAAKQARLLDKLKNDPSSPLYASSTPSPSAPASPSSVPNPKMTDAELLEWAKAQPPVKRRTVEESLERWLESQEPTLSGPGS